MSKKIVALLLVLTLCLTSMVALAAPSKTSRNTTTVKTEEPETVVETAAPTAETRAELEEIATFVNEGNTIVAYFAEEVQQEIAAALPEGTDAATLKMDEFIPLAVTGTASGSASVTVSTAASYSKDDVVVTMISYMVNGVKVWKTVPCTIVDGKLVVELDADLVAQIAGGSAALMIISNK